MLYRLLKNVSKWVFKTLEKSGEAIAEAEEIFHFGKVVSNNESNKK